MRNNELGSVTQFWPLKYERLQGDSGKNIPLGRKGDIKFPFSVPVLAENGGVEG